MAINQTEYLQLPYGETGDVGFRTQYVQYLDKVDSLFPTQESTKYSPGLNPIYSDSFFTPSKDFTLKPDAARYLQLGSIIFFEIALFNKNAIVAPVSGNIGNIVLGTIRQDFPRIRGWYVTAINGIAAHYSYGGEKGATISLASFGGNPSGNTIAKNTNFGIAGHFQITG